MIQHHATPKQVMDVISVFSRQVGVESDGTPIWQVPEWCEVFLTVSLQTKSL